MVEVVPKNLLPKAPQPKASDVLPIIDNYRDTVVQTREKLEAEIAEIQKSHAEIEKDFNAEVLAFLKGTAEKPGVLTQISGSHFDRFAEATENVKELRAGSLKTTRDELVAQRDVKLAEIIHQFGEGITIENFEEKLGEVAAKAAALKTAADEANTASQAATSSLETWRQSDEYKIVRIDNEIAKYNETAQKKEPRIEVANTSFFNPPTGIFASAKSLFDSDRIKNARTALADYAKKHSGKEIFADINPHRENDAKLLAARETAVTVATAAMGEFSAARTAATNMAKYSGTLKPDDQILAQLQERAATFFQTEAAMNAIGDEFGKDFPPKIALLFAKLKTLDKLEEGADQKLEGIKKELRDSSQTRSQMRQMGNQPVNVDLAHEQLKYDTKVIEYHHYYDSVYNGRSRTVGYYVDDYGYYYGGYGGAAFAVDAMLLTMEATLFANMIYAGTGPYMYMGGPVFGPGFAYAPYSCYSCGYMGYGPGSFGPGSGFDGPGGPGGPSGTVGDAPPGMFDAPQDVASNMSQLGVENYEPGSMTSDNPPDIAAPEGTDSLETVATEAADTQQTADAGGNDYNGGGGDDQPAAATEDGANYGGGGDPPEDDNRSVDDDSAADTTGNTDYSGGGNEPEEEEEEAPPEEEDDDDNNFGGGGGGGGDEECITSSIMSEPNKAVRGTMSRTRFAPNLTL